METKLLEIRGKCPGCGQVYLCIKNDTDVYLEEYKKHAAHCLRCDKLWEIDLQQYKTEVKKKSKIREFDTGATRDTSEGKQEYIGFNSPLADRRFAEYMTNHRKQTDGKMRCSSNWKKGIPKEAYKESAGRHWMDIRLHWDGHKVQNTLEDSLCAMRFNINGYLHEVLKEKEGKESLESHIARRGKTGIEDIAAGTELNKHIKISEESRKTICGDTMKKGLEQGKKYTEGVGCTNNIIKLEY